jgi:uncharacterized BrkB/YihY/UPF0761 family membrane protein
VGPPSASHAVVWLLASSSLPAARGVPWTAVVPGAVVLGVGLEALHVFTVYFLATKLASASALYGSLGLAGTMLFYLFLVGSGVVWAAELNAVVWEVRRRQGVSPPDGTCRDACGRVPLGASAWCLGSV